MPGTAALIALLSLAAPQAAAATPDELPRYGGVNLVNETPERHDARMAWFREAKFGMFIHWGAYSTAGGEWNGRQVRGVGEWLLSNAQIKPEDYEVLQKRFNPVKYDAKEWVRIAKDAGMKYIVITSKHHDGFCLWDSALTGWDVGGSPFAPRDPLKELADACTEAGIRVYPTWIKGGERRDGVLSVEELQRWSGYRPGGATPAGSNSAVTTP